MGGTKTAWFFTAGFERACFAPGTFATPWHCLLPDAYNNGALWLEQGMQIAAKVQGWQVIVRLDQRKAGTTGYGSHSGGGTGLADVPYSDNVYVITVKQKPIESAKQG
jgi:hypothetical protein